MDNDINLYIELHTEAKKLRLQQKTLKDKIKACDEKFLEYMSQNNIPSIQHKGGCITLYSKKVSKKLKQQEVQDKIIQQLGNPEKAKEIAEIISNKTSETKEAIKCTLK